MSVQKGWIVTRVHQDENYWQLSRLDRDKDGNARWYTAKKMAHLPGGWLIINARGTEVKPTAKIGQAIIAAVEADTAEGVR